MGELRLQDQGAGTCRGKLALAQSEQSFSVNPAPWQEKGICAEFVTTGMGKGSRGGGRGAALHCRRAQSTNINTLRGNRIPPTS